jgi:hypothetical protein
MKKIFIIISVVFTSIVLLFALFVAGMFVWEHFAEKRKDKNSDEFSWLSAPQTVEETEGYEWDGDDEPDYSEGDTPDSEFAPENQVRLNARLMSLTARDGMNSGYDDLRTAIAFASEALDYSSFPNIPHGYSFTENPEEWDRYLAEYTKWGEGMETLRRLIGYAYRQKSNDLTGIDKLVRRFGRLIQTMFPRQKYVANGFEKMVNQLLVAYNDLSANPNNFRKVFNIMNAGLNFPDECIEVIRPMIRDQQLTAFISDHDVEYYVERGEVNHHSVAWAYSFWGRRYDENPGNILPIASALKILRDELYAPNAPTPNLDPNHPPIEPYLTSKLRAGEPIYPWKMYTARVEFVSADDNSEYAMMKVRHNDEEIWLFDASPDELNFKRGNIIDITWCYEIFLSYGEDAQMEFREFVYSVKLAR